MSESFNWDVVRVLYIGMYRNPHIFIFQAYSTTFEQIEQLRELMLAFLTSERRDYMPSFDVFVVGMHNIFLARITVIDHAHDL